jgi:hypothetical protein
MFAKVIGKSVLKALKRVGLTVGSVAAVAGATAFANPDVTLPIVLSLGPWGPLAAVALAVGSAAVLDAAKHLPKGDEPAE